jgi:DNA primase
VINREIHHIVQKIFGDVRGYLESEQIQVCCPMCQQKEQLLSSDNKYNLEISTTRKIFRCWKCSDPEFKGSLGYLIKRYGSYNDYENYKLFYGFYDDNNKDYFEDEEVQVYLPKEFISFKDMDITNPEHFSAYTYLVTERKITREQILYYNMGFCIEGKYKNHIIIPSYDKYDNLNYFIARVWDDTIRQKYNNPKANKNNIIFNEKNIVWSSTIFLVEGFFDMLAVPYNGIPLLGKKIGFSLFYKLNQIKPYVIVPLDPDAYKENVELIQQLKNIYIGCEEKVRIVELSKKDNYDLDKIRKVYGIDKIIKNLYNARDLNVDDMFAKKLSYSGYSTNNKFKYYKKKY